VHRVTYGGGWRGPGPTTSSFSSDTHITTTVPDGASSGRITVTTPSGTATSATNFSVTLSVTGFTPTSGLVGSTVYVTGVAFSGVSGVTFNGMPAQFTPLGNTILSAHCSSRRDLRPDRGDDSGGHGAQRGRLHRALTQGRFRLR
jgi:hypothetical protein